ncbi:hypothetical protein BDF21DRAFT_8690 [Thamnidium elegans]|nr:hypothetical protein BDF21DRAFT_8690 [Thamnidium elegans]
MQEQNQAVDYKRVFSGLLEKTQLLSFRKIKLSSKLYYDQTDLKLLLNLRRKFGKDSAPI